MTLPPRAAASVARWPLWLLLVQVACLGCFEANDGDIGFHLATGREILRTGSIPSQNVLSYTEPLHPWLLHQGVPALLFEWLWQRAGWPGLMALKLIVLAGTWAFSFAATRALRVSSAWAAGVGLFAASASAFRFELRPYLFTHLTLSCVVWAVYSSVGAARLGRSAVIAACAVCLGWQLHAGAIDSVLVLGLFALGTCLERLRPKLLHEAARAPSGPRAAATFVAAAAVGVAAAGLCFTLYQPSGLNVLGVPFQMATHPYWQQHLIEFRHPWQLPLHTLWAYWALLAIFVLATGCALRSLHAGVLMAAGAYALVSLLYVRMAYAFALVAAPPLAWVLEQHWRRWQVRRSQRSAGEAEQAPAVRAPLVLVALSVVAALYVFRDHRFGIGASAWIWPRGHFAFVREHALRGHAFVSDAWAGPFLGEFYPARRAFFDNRLEAYSDALAVGTYQRIRYGRPGWDKLLDRYDVQFLLLRYTTPSEARRQGSDVNLRQRLAADPRYALVYFDDVGELFLRREGPNAPLAAAFAIEGVDPDRHGFLVRPGRAAPALLRAVERGMQSQTAIGLLTLALADAGDLPHARKLAAGLLAQAPEDAFAQRVARSLSRARP